MKQNTHIFLLATAAIIVSLMLFLPVLGKSQNAVNTVQVKFNDDAVLETDYLGNGVQWDPYAFGDISAEAWKKTVERLDFMRVRLVRLLMNPNYYCTSFPPGGRPVYNFDNEKTRLVFKILDYCQKMDVAVILGEWGNPSGPVTITDPSKHNLGFDGIHEEDPRWPHMVCDFLDYLINVRHYTCIKYYNLGNEPNTKNSLVKSFRTWRQSIFNLDAELNKRGFRNKIQIVGPDATGYGSDWVDSIALDPKFAHIMDLYEIHFYADAKDIESGKFENMLGTIKDRIAKEDANGAHKKFFIGEAGMATGHAPKNDQQQLIGTFQYGVWMADYAAEAMDAGLGGLSAWDLDDAMHIDTRKPGDNNIRNFLWKEWGFWDSYAKEKGKPELMNLRPWYYTWSLLSKYMPPHSKVLKVLDPLPPVGVRCTAIKLRASNKTYYTFLIVNDAAKSNNITLTMPNIESAGGEVKQFNFFENEHPQDANGFPVPKTKIPEAEFGARLKTGFTVNMPSKGVIIFTTAPL